MTLDIDKKRLARQFGKHAAEYDQVTPVQSAMARRLVDASASHFHDPELVRNILELGCGTGMFTLKLLQQFPQARIQALDICAEMLTQTRLRLAPISLSVDYVLADGETYLSAIPGTVTFDLITANATVQWFRDAPAFAATALTRLAPGGVLSFTTFGPDTFYELTDAFKTASARLGVPPHGHTLEFLEPSRWQTLAQHAGLALTITREPHTVWFPSVREFLRSIQRAGASLAPDKTHPPLNRQLYHQMCQNYETRYRHPQTPQIQATYDVVTVIYHKPHRTNPANTLTPPCPKPC